MCYTVCRLLTPQLLCGVGATCLARKEVATMGSARPVAASDGSASISAQSTPTAQVSDGYKWIALSNTTLGTLMATINSSIILISMPAIFTRIAINPLAPGETNYFLWLL